MQKHIKKELLKLAKASLWLAAGVLIWGLSVYIIENGHVSLGIKIFMLFFLASAYYTHWRCVKNKCFRPIYQEDNPFMYYFVKWASFFTNVLLSIGFIYYCIFY